MTPDRTEDSPVDRAQSDDLNRLLDDPHRGLPEGDSALDPALVATVRAVASIGGGVRPGNGEEANALWRSLLRSEARREAAITPSRGAPLGLVSSPVTLRWSRGRELAVVRVIAAIAAVVVISLTAASLYSDLTGGQTTPTVMAAGGDLEATAKVPAGAASCSTEGVTATSTAATATDSTVTNAMATRSTATRSVGPSSPTRSSCTGVQPGGGAS